MVFIAEVFSPPSQRHPSPTLAEGICINHFHFLHLCFICRHEDQHHKTFTFWGKTKKDASLAPSQVSGKLLAITFTFHACVLCVVPSQLSHFQYFQKKFTLLSQKRCLFALSQVSGPCQCRQTTGTFTFYICVLYRNHLTFTFWREKRMQSSSSAHKCQAYASAGKLLPLSISLSTFSTN